MSIRDIKVEAAFGSTMLTASPSWTDISGDVRVGSTSRERPSLEGSFATGRGQLTLGNRTGNYNPADTSGAHYPNVQVGTPIRITEGDAEEPIFYGSTRAWKPLYSQADSEVVVPLADGFYTLNQTDLAGAEFPAQSTTDRIDAVLDHIGWAAGLRDYDDPLGSVQAKAFAQPNDGGRQPALPHLLDVAEAEGGVLFMSRDGKVTFRNRVTHSGASPAFTLDDDNIHRALPGTFDDSYLWNVFKIAREDGAQVVLDASAGEVERALVKDVMPMADDAQALNLAQWLDGVFGEQRFRIESLPLKMTNLQPHYADVLGAELRDFINVTHATQFGDTIDQDCAIESIHHEWARGGNWRVTFSVEPLSTFETQEYWILGTSALDVSTRLA